jgi:hypothetical protein
VPILDYSFVNRGRTLRFDGKILDGWERRANGMAFVGQSNFDLPMVLHEGRFDFATRAQVTLFCRNMPWLSEPYIPSCDAVDRGVTVTGNADRLIVDAKLFGPDDLLDGSLPWGVTRESLKPRLHWQIPFSVSRSSSLPIICYELQLLIVFSHPRNQPPPVEWDRGSGHFSGGLPSLGRR